MYTALLVEFISQRKLVFKDMYFVPGSCDKFKIK
jgi:hypothetical protein